MEKYINFYHKFIYIICYFNIAITKLLLGLVLVMIGYQIFARATIGGAPLGINELSQYLTVWITYLLIFNLILSDEHLKIEFLYNGLPTVAQKVIMYSYLSALAAIGAVMVYVGSRYALVSGFRSSARTLPGDIAMFYFYIVIPVCGVLILLATLYRLLDEIGVLTITDDVKRLGRFRGRDA